jgi:spore germination cell wall hydrolase CwlJ-like protein
LFSLTQTRGYPRALIGAVVSGAGLSVLAAAICLTVGFAPAQAQKAQVAPVTRLAIIAPIDAAMQQDGALRAQDATHAVTALASSRELDCLATAVYYEARGESAAGQAAVAQVVLNRVRHPAFPKTICGVVYQGASRGAGCQFSYTSNCARRRANEPGAWPRARQIASRALGGYVMAEVGLATNFHVVRLGRVWGGRMIRIGQVGGHVFYRMNSRGQHAAPALPSTGLAQSTVPAAAAVEAAYAVADAVAAPAPESPTASAAKPATPSAQASPTAPSASDAGQPAAATAS